MANDQHIQWLQQNVALYRRLPAELRTDLLAMIPGFIKHVTWAGQDGHHITEEMKVCIAAEACLPVLRLSQGLKTYRKLMTIQVFPGEFSPPGESPRPGDANARQVRLGWQWVQKGMADGEDGYNLVLHEFAHIIDFASLDSKADGVPPFDSYVDTREWEQFVARHYEDFQREIGEGQHVIDHYGSSNEAEFFACATESFFERGAHFQIEWPDIYENFKKYYGVDPATWPADPSPPLPEPSAGETEPTEAEPAAEEPVALEPPAPVAEPKAAGSPLVEIKVDASGLGNITEFHPNGKRACQWELRDHIHDGPWRRWSSDDELLEEGWYRKGKRAGRYSLYFPGGPKRVDGQYKNDKRDGTWRRYREDGQMKQEDHYEKGELVRWEQWDASGESKKIGAWE